MSLLDHFRPPIDPRIGWESFHHRWANAIADHLDQLLPSRCFARVEVHLGSDVATDITEEELIGPAGANGTGGVAVQTYTPPAATVLMPAFFPDEAAVEVRSVEPGARLLAVIELVSPANKKSPDARRAFVTKGVAFLQNGIGLVVIDPVGDRRFNLHDQLAETLTGRGSFAMPGTPAMYTAAYRPTSTEQTGAGVEGWTYPLAVGEALPVVPLYLRGHGCIQLDLDATYSETRRRIRF